jgi:hypothetical protein
MLPENTDAGVETPGEGAAGAESADTSTDFGEGFDDAFAELSEGLPETGGEGTEGADAATSGDEQQAAEQGPEQQPGGEQQPSQQQQGQEQEPQDYGLNLSSTGTVDQILQALMQNEGQIAQAVGQNLFQLSAQDKEALETDAAAALPALAGRVYVKALQASTSLVRNVIPQMLQAEMNRQNAMISVEQAFFQQFPELDRWQHGRDIIAVGQAMQAQNPGMHPQELLMRTAQAVMGMHGIQRRARRGNGQQPFRPAPSGPVGQQPSLAEEMPFAGLGMDFEE